MIQKVLQMARLKGRWKELSKEYWTDMMREWSTGQMMATVTADQKALHLAPLMALQTDYSMACPMVKQTAEI